MKKFFSSNRIFINLSLAFILMLSSIFLPNNFVSAKRAKVNSAEYISVEKTYEANKDKVALLVNELDLKLDSDVTELNQVRFLLDVTPLMTKVYPQTIKIKAYTKNSENKENIISIINSTIYKKNQALNYSFVLDIPASFNSNDIFLDVYDADAKLQASFKQYIEYTASQEDEVLQSADCTDEFGDCQLQYILNAISYQVGSSKKADTIITKNTNGKYTLSLPMYKSQRHKIVNKITQEPNEDEENPDSSFNMDQLVNLIARGNFGFDKVQLAPKELATDNLPADGTLEFDGENLFIVKDGQRVELGKQGPSGPSGSAGPQGPAGPSGSFSGGDADIHGTLTFLSQGTLLNPNIEGVMKLDYLVDPPDSPELGDLYHDSSSAICVYLENKWQRLIGEGNCKPGLLVPKLLTYPALSDLNIYYPVSISPVYNGDLNSTFSISPSLPAGLVLNTTTGVISGTPTALSAIQTYTVTVSNSLGSLSNTFSLGVFDESLDLASIAVSTDVLPRASGAGSVEVIGSQVFLIGGHNSTWSGAHHTSVQYANTATPTSFTNYGVGTLPSPIAWSDTAQVGDYVYALGSVQGTTNQVLRAHKTNLASWSSYATLPGAAYLSKVFVDEDSVFVLGGGASGDLVYRAPIDDLTIWQNLGSISGFTRSMHFFQVNTDLYTVSATNVYRSSTHDITNWVNISAAAPPAEANAGISALIGSKAYIIGNFMSRNIYSASVADMGTWTLEPNLMPILAWGMHHGVRIGNTYYIYGGMNTSYLGITSIFTIPIIKTYV